MNFKFLKFYALFWRNYSIFSKQDYNRRVDKKT